MVFSIVFPPESMAIFCTILWVQLAKIIKKEKIRGKFLHFQLKQQDQTKKKKKTLFKK